MHREKMDGVNLREGIMEVAFEQWTERTCGRQQNIDSSVPIQARLTWTVQVGANVFLRYREAVSDDRDDQIKWLIRLIPVPAESRDHSLNSGGNTDEGFALSI